MAQQYPPSNPMIALTTFHDLEQMHKDRPKFIEEQLEQAMKLIEEKLGGTVVLDETDEAPLT